MGALHARFDFGGDGYLGWPTAMHFSARGDDVVVVDNFAKRRWELEEGIEPLLPVPTLHARVKRWARKFQGATSSSRSAIWPTTASSIRCSRHSNPTLSCITASNHLLPTMQSRETAVYTQTNNIVGNLNVLFAMRHACPDAHLVKLGTMGEYGTPNIDIEEGWLTLNHNGRSDTVLYPKKPGSFYHLSKEDHSHNIEFACRIWGIRSTDLNQGVVYGIETDQTVLHPDLRTSFSNT